MRKITWREGYTQSGFSTHLAKIGSITITVNPKIDYPYGDYDKRRLVGWTFVFYDGHDTHYRENVKKSLEMAKEDAEKTVIQFLYDRGIVVAEELKKIGLLEGVLSEIEIDL